MHSRKNAGASGPGSNLFFGQNPEKYSEILVFRNFGIRKNIVETKKKVLTLYWFKNLEKYSKSGKILRISGIKLLGKIRKVRKMTKSSEKYSKNPEKYQLNLKI